MIATASLLNAHHAVWAAFDVNELRAICLNSLHLQGAAKRKWRTDSVVRPEVASRQNLVGNQDVEQSSASTEIDTHTALLVGTLAPGWSGDNAWGAKCDVSSGLVELRYHLVATCVASRKGTQQWLVSWHGAVGMPLVLAQST